MPSVSGALSGASTGASIGSIGGPAGMAIGAGIGGLIGLFKGGQPKWMKELYGKINPVQSNLINWSGEDMDMSRLFRSLGLESMQDVDKFYRSILSSNPGALNSLLGPARSDVAKNYQSVLDTANMGARGGGRTATGMEFDFRKAGDLLKLIPEARMGAAAKLGEGGQAAAGLGLEFGKSATQRSATVLDSIASILGGTSSDRARSSTNSRDDAYQLGKLLGPLMRRGGGGGPYGSATGGDIPGQV